MSTRATRNSASIGLIGELQALAQDLRSRAAGGDARRLQRGRHARARLCEEPLRRRRARQCAKTRSATPSRAGKAASPILRPSAPARTSTRFPTPASTTACVGVLGGLEAIRVLQTARIQAAAIDRAGHLHRRRADALRHRLPGQPHDGQRAHARSRRWRCATRKAAAWKSCARRPDSPARLNPSPCRTAASINLSSCTLSRVRYLEQEGIDVGLVTHIAAPASQRIRDRRRRRPRRRQADAGPQRCARRGSRVDSRARSPRPNPPAQSTPSAPWASAKSFPARSTAFLRACGSTTDVRDIDRARRDGVLDALEGCLQRSCARAAASRSRRNWSTPIRPPPAIPRFLRRLKRRPSQQARATRRMVARAYHDSSFVACIAPVAMLFIPCRGGVSHRPDEYASPEWIGSGRHVLARTLARLACMNDSLCNLTRAVVCYASTRTAIRRLLQP